MLRTVQIAPNWFLDVWMKDWTKTVMDWQDMTSGYGDWIAVCGSVRASGVWKCRWWQGRPIINSSLGHLIQPQPSQANEGRPTNASEFIGRPAIVSSLGTRLRTSLARIWLPTCRVLELHVSTAECIWFCGEAATYQNVNSLGRRGLSLKDMLLMAKGLY